MVEIQQSKMQISNELHRVKTFHYFEDSNYFRRERTYDVVMETNDF
jgi:hypothetical protein